MKLFQGGDLRTFLNSYSCGSSVPIHLAVVVMRQVLSALRHTHSLDIAHWDIKATSSSHHPTTSSQNRPSNLSTSDLRLASNATAKKLRFHAGNEYAPQAIKPPSCWGVNHTTLLWISGAPESCWQNCWQGITLKSCHGIRIKRKMKILNGIKSLVVKVRFVL